MITIITGTNRKNNLSRNLSELVGDILSGKSEKYTILHLENLPENFIFHNIYTGKPSREIHTVTKQYMNSAQKFIFIIPEYNGSFPGVLKAFIDAVPPESWKNKKALLIGLSAGRAGNIRGLDHFTGVLHYLKTTVYPFKFTIPQAESRLSDERKQELRKKITPLIDDFLNF